MDKFTIVKNVVGKVAGLFKGSQAKRSSLVILHKHPEFNNLHSIPIGSIDTLPSACPWLSYKLDIKLDHSVPEQYKYQIIRVHSVEPLPVTKQSLIDFVTIKKVPYMKHDYQTEQPAEEEGEEFVNVIAKQKRYYNGVLKDVPKQINSLGDINGQIEDGTLLREIRDLVEVALRNDPTFYRLLRYFSDRWLLRFTADELAVIELLLVRDPWSFVFWDGLIDNLRFRDLLSPEAASLFLVDWNRINEPHKLLDMLLRDENSLLSVSNLTVRYMTYFPLLCLYKLQFVLQDYSKIIGKENIRQETIALKWKRKALAYYLECKKQFHLRADLVLCLWDYNNLQASREELQITEDEFQVITGYLTFMRVAHRTVGTYVEGPEPVQGRHAIMPYREFVEECELASFFLDAYEIHMHNFSYYDETYCKRVVEIYNKYKELDPHKVTVLLITVNESCKFHLQLGTKLPVYTMRELGMVVETKDVVCLIDQFHKIGYHDLYQWVKFTQNRGFRRIVLELFGYNLERPPASHLGGGKHFTDLCALAGDGSWKNADYTNHEWKAKSRDKQHDQLSNVYRSMMDNLQSNILTMTLVNEKNFKTEIHRIEKVINKESKEVKDKNQVQPHHKPVDYYLFCSNEATKDELLNELFKIKNHDYTPSRFYVGYKVYVVERDLIGILQAVKRIIDPATADYQDLESNTGVDLYFGHYLFTVDGQEYDSWKFCFQHANVLNINKFCARPLEHVLFYVTLDTTKNQLLSALKYTKQKIKLLLASGVTLVNVYNTKEQVIRSDFKDKLELALVNEGEDNT